MKRLFHFKKKYGGFMIPDLLAGMAIAAIVISLAYYGLQLVTLQYRNYLQNAGILSDIQRFSLLFNKDIQDAVEIEGDSTAMILRGKDDNIIKWQAHSGCFIRTHSSQPDLNDTVTTIAQINTVVYYTSPASKDQVIHKIMIDAFLYGDTIQMFFEKKYSAEELINAIKTQTDEY